MQDKREKFFKPSSEKESLSQRTLKTGITLRKKSIDQFFEAKRFNNQNFPPIFESEDKENNDYYQVLIKSHVQPEKLDQFCQMIRNPKTLLEGLIGLRKIMASPNNPPFQTIVTNGTLIFLIGLLEEETRPNYIYEILWIFVNVTSCYDSKYTSILVDNGIINIIMPFLTNPNKNYFILDQATWLIANIGGDCEENRERLSQLGVVEQLIKFLSYSTHTQLIDHILWALRNFSAKNSLTQNQGRGLAKIMIKYIQKRRHTKDCMKILHDLITSTKGVARMIVDSDLTKDFMTMLQTNCHRYESIRIVGVLIAEDESATTEFVRLGIIEEFYKKLKSEVELDNRKEICWSLYNLISGNSSNADHFFKVKGLIRCLFELYDSENYIVQKEIFWTLCNLTSSKIKKNILKLYRKGIVQIIEVWIDNPEFGIQGACIEALDNILAMIGKFSLLDEVYADIANKDIFDKIEMIAVNSKHTQLARRAMSFLKKYSDDPFSDDFTEGLTDHTSFKVSSEEGQPMEMEDF